MPPSAKPGLPLRWQNTPDGRSTGKAIQLARDMLAQHPEGISREKLEQSLRSELGDRFSTGPRAFGELLYRLRRHGEVSETDGILVPKRLTRTTGADHG